VSGAAICLGIIMSAWPYLLLYGVRYEGLPAPRWLKGLPETLAFVLQLGVLAFAHVILTGVLFGLLVEFWKP
jgi:hypothetical protein